MNTHFIKTLDEVKNLLPQAACTEPDKDSKLTWKLPFGLMRLQNVEKNFSGVDAYHQPPTIILNTTVYKLITLAIIE